MSQEREAESSPQQLTESQQNTAQSIVDLLEHSSQPKCAVLRGPSGVGKTSVLTHIRRNPALSNVAIAEQNQIRYNSALDSHTGHIVTCDTVGEVQLMPLEKDLARKYPAAEIIIFKVGGMSADETRNFLLNHHGTSIPSLQPEDIVRYSMGIPLLVEQLTSPSISEEDAIKIAAAYLNRNFGVFAQPNDLLAAASQYINIQIPESVVAHAIEVARESKKNRIYDLLHHALSIQMKLRKQGIYEQDPFFIDSESERIYDEMLASGERVWLDIYAPDLSTEDLARIHEAFGYSTKNGEYDQHSATRIQMFSDDYRKVSFWHRDEHGDELLDSGEYDGLGKQIPNYEKARQSGVLGLSSETARGKCSFFIHAHEHNGYAFHSARIGYMTETLLQQMGIPYFVNNDTYDASYYYEPTTKSIYELPERVKISKW